MNQSHIKRRMCWVSLLLRALQGVSGVLPPLSWVMESFIPGPLWPQPCLQQKWEMLSHSKLPCSLCMGKCLGKCLIHVSVTSQVLAFLSSCPDPWVTFYRSSGGRLLGKPLGSRVGDAEGWERRLLISMIKLMIPIFFNDFEGFLNEKWKWNKKKK